MTTIREIQRFAGIGLRLPHIAEVVATRPAVGWLEIHPENFLENPHAMELLTELAKHYPISVHTVGISVGSVCGIDRAHLARIRSLVERINPVFVSGHLAWSTQDGDYLNDLLPIPYNEESLQLAATHIHEVQARLGRPYLIENPSSYLGFQTSTMPETEFLRELVVRTNCRLLCDVSNIYLSAHNMGYDAREYVDQFPAEAVAELHMGGFTPEEDAATLGEEIWIDTHECAVADGAWDLYAYAIRRFGVLPTLIEWDSNIPPLAILLKEAARAKAIAAGTVSVEACHASSR